MGSCFQPSRPHEHHDPTASRPRPRRVRVRRLRAGARLRPLRGGFHELRRDRARRGGEGRDLRRQRPDLDLHGGPVRPPEGELRPLREADRAGAGRPLRPPLRLLPRRRLHEQSGRVRPRARRRRAYLRDPRDGGPRRGRPAGPGDPQPRLEGAARQGVRRDGRALPGDGPPVRPHRRTTLRVPSDGVQLRRPRGLRVQPRAAAGVDAGGRPGASRLGALRLVRVPPPAARGRADGAGAARAGGARGHARGRRVPAVRHERIRPDRRRLGGRLRGFLPARGLGAVPEPPHRHARPEEGREGRPAGLQALDLRGRAVRPPEPPAVPVELLHRAAGHRRPPRLGRAPAGVGARLRGRPRAPERPAGAVDRRLVRQGPREGPAGLQGRGAGGRGPGEVPAPATASSRSSTSRRIRARRRSPAASSSASRPATPRSAAIR